MGEGAKVAAFVTGINKDIARTMLNQAVPDTFSAAVATARVIEDSLRLLKDTPINTVDNSSTGSVLAILADKINQLELRDKNIYSISKEERNRIGGSVPGATCFYCGADRHIATQCRLRDNDLQSRFRERRGDEHYNSYHHSQPDNYPSRDRRDQWEPRRDSYQREDRRDFAPRRDPRPQGRRESWQERRDRRNKEDKREDRRREDRSPSPRKDKYDRDKEKRREEKPSSPKKDKYGGRERKDTPKQEGKSHLNACNTVQAINPTPSKNSQYSPTYLDAKFHDSQVRILVDTGASLSLIQAELLYTISKQSGTQPIIKEWDRGVVRTAGGEGLQMKGTTTITIDLGDVDLCMPVAIVEGLSKTFIIGVDVLNKTRTVIDLSKKNITFAEKHTIPLDIMAGEVLVMEETATYNPECYTYKAVANKEYTVPPYSTELIHTEIPHQQREELGRNRYGIVASNPEEEENKEPLLVAYSIISLEDNNFATQVFNMSRVPLLIKAGRVVATVERVKESEILDKIPSSYPISKKAMEDDKKPPDLLSDVDSEEESN